MGRRYRIAGRADIESHLNRSVPQRKPAASATDLNAMTRAGVPAFVCDPDR
jgi:hypothetical protein